MIPGRFTLNSLADGGIVNAGFYAIGWRNKSSGQVPVAPCYKLFTFGKVTPADKCEDGISNAEVTNFIRVHTVFGVCTALYGMDNNVIRRVEAIPGVDISTSCTLR